MGDPRDTSKGRGSKNEQVCPPAISPFMPVPHLAFGASLWRCLDSRFGDTPVLACVDSCPSFRCALYCTFSLGGVCLATPRCSHVWSPVPCSGARFKALCAGKRRAPSFMSPCFRDIQMVVIVEPQPFERPTPFLCVCVCVCVCATECARSVVVEVVVVVVVVEAKTAVVEANTNTNTTQPQTRT